MAGLGIGEVLIILVIILVLFGGARLPKIARSLGEAKRELTTAMRAEDEPSADDDGLADDDVAGDR